MIPHSFEYEAPANLKDALAAIATGDTRLLAGGMSLIPIMKFRFAQPERVVDLGRVPGLNGIEAAGASIRIGAMATHHEVETSAVLRAKCPLLAETAAQIGDPAVRNMGTIGGSVAHADPAADYPAALLALEARLRLATAKGERTLPIADFLLDAFTTALAPGEMIVEIEVPVEESGEGYSYEKVSHPASGFAVVGVAVRVKKSGGKISLARIAVTGVASHAFRATNAEKLLESGAAPDQAAAAVAEGIDANSDLYASAEYRLHLARVHARRAIATALSRTT